MVLGRSVSVYPASEWEGTQRKISSPYIVGEDRRWALSWAGMLCWWDQKRGAQDPLYRQSDPRQRVVQLIVVPHKSFVDIFVEAMTKCFIVFHGWRRSLSTTEDKEYLERVKDSTMKALIQRMLALFYCPLKQPPRVKITQGAQGPRELGSRKQQWNKKPCWNI